MAPAAQAENAAKPASGSAPGHPAAAAENADGSPDLTRETACVMARWSSTSPAWQRETIEWHADTRTLEYVGTTRRFGADGHVQDFGAGKDHLEYDARGNITFRGGAEGDLASTAYHYKNRYDAAQRLIGVDIATRAPKGKLSAYAPYRRYHYDTQGQLDRMELQIVPGGALVGVHPEWNAQGQLTKLTWGDGSALQQRDTFEYDASGRLERYTRDGLIVPPGRAADGTIEWTQHWEYDAQGAATLMDGVEGLDPAKSPHEQTRWSPGCAGIGKLWQDLYVFPYVPLPAGLVPRFAQAS